MSERGFSLVELLVACAMALLVTGTLASMAGPVREVFEQNTTRVDLASGRAAALEILAADIREAGSDADIGDPDARLAAVLPVIDIMPSLDDESAAQSGGALRVTRVPRGAAQALLAAAVAAGESTLPLQTLSRCRGGDSSCGFHAGMRAVVYDAVAARRVTAAHVGPGVLTTAAPLPASFGAGAAVAELQTTTYGTRSDGNGAWRLVRLTTGGAEQPILDDVVQFAVAADSDAWSRIRRVEVVLRLQATSPALRGPAGPLFRQAGTASSPRRWVPDTEVRLGVALRNAAGEP